MTAFERKICEFKAEENAIRSEKEKLDKIHMDLVNQTNLLNLIIAAKIKDGDDVTDFLSKQEDLNKEIDRLNSRVEDLAERTNKLIINYRKLLGNIIF